MTRLIRIGPAFKPRPAGAYLAGKLAAMTEGETAVPDNSCLMFVSNMWSGSRHDSGKLPVPARSRRTCRRNSPSKNRFDFRPA